MLADYCWMLKREATSKDAKYCRKQLHRSFEDKKTRYIRKNR